MNQQQFLAGNPRIDNVKKLYDYLSTSGVFACYYSDGTSTDRDYASSIRYFQHGPRRHEVAFNPQGFTLAPPAFPFRSTRAAPLLASVYDRVIYWFAQWEHKTGRSLFWIWPMLREKERRTSAHKVYSLDGSPLAHALPDWNKLDQQHWFHQSQTDPECVAYFASEAKLRADVSTRISVGRFIKKFWPDTDDNRVRRLVNEYREWLGCRTVLFTTDPDTIVDVYANGPRSCMRGMDCVEVYGNSPDLALAYLGTPEDASARAIVWPDRKVYVRIYGDDLLGMELERLGYSHGDLEGARVRRIEHYGRIVMPYLDGPQCVDYSSDNRYMVIRESGDFDAANTNGYCSPVTRCFFCGESSSEDELYTANDGEDVCSACIGTNDYEATSRQYVWARVSERYSDEHDVRRRSDCWWSTYHESWISDDLSLSDFELVELEDGRVVDECDAVEDIDGCWQLADECVEVECYKYVLTSDLHDGQFRVEPDGTVVFDGDGLPLLESWAKLVVATGEDSDAETVAREHLDFYSDEVRDFLCDEYAGDVERLADELAVEELPLTYQPECVALYTFKPEVFTEAV